MCRYVKGVIVSGTGNGQIQCNLVPTQRRWQSVVVMKSIGYLKRDFLLLGGHQIGLKGLHKSIPVVFRSTVLHAQTASNSVWKENKWLNWEFFRSFHIRRHFGLQEPSGDCCDLPY